MLFRLLSWIGLFSLFSLIIIGCNGASSFCQGNGVGPLEGDFHGFQCKYTCECNNQTHLGVCKENRCITLGVRQVCLAKAQIASKQNKDVREVLVSNRFFRKECPAALSSEQCPSKTYEKICQDKGLFASLWGNCRCVGGLCPVGTTVCSRDCSVKKPCACVELRTDSKHCGQCENRCPQGAICQNGQCPILHSQ